MCEGRETQGTERGNRKNMEGKVAFVVAGEQAERDSDLRTVQTPRPKDIRTEESP